MPQQKQKGFTLIELMVTVAIVAIIAAIAYPSYLKSAQKGRRADAKASLTQYSQALERCYTEYGFYKSSRCGVFTTLQGGGYNTAHGYYVVTAPSVTSTTYALAATAVSTGPQASDTGCTIMTLNNQGQQGSGSATATSDTGSCW